MSEEPTKLFATRAELFPQPEYGDTARAAVEKIIEQVPVFGPATTFMLSRFWVPSANRRLEEWLKDFADDFDRHKESCKGVSVENLEQNEAFVSATIQIARIAIGTHQQEKRKYLRNALLNIAIGKGPDEVRQQIFLNAIEAFSPAHVKTLNVIWRGPALNIPWDKSSITMARRNYCTAIEIMAPELNGQMNVIEAILTDLRNRGFSKLGGLELSFPQGGINTGLGVEFLKFVLNPDDLPS